MLSWSRILSIALLAQALAGSCLAYKSQHFFGVNGGFVDGAADDHYELKWPVKKVAIIGAGPSGMLAYREFTREGFDVHVFERDDVAGGNWHYTEEVPLPAPIPNAPIQVGDFVPDLPPQGATLPYTQVYHPGTDEEEKKWEDKRIDHRGPKPVWASLTSNAPAPWQQFVEIPWPEGTQWELTHGMLQRYMRSFASFHGINSNDNNPKVSYNTRVELVEKRYDENGNEHGWTLTLKKLVRTGDKTYRATWYEADFDAVVVATGRFTAPYMPPIPGLAEWASQHPDRIVHSRQYRTPEKYANETVLIVGAATSGGEISRDINPYAKKVYQSIRPDNSSVLHFYLPNFLGRVPANTSIVPEIKSFSSPSPGASNSICRIELINGTVISDVDRIIFSTGFRYSFPFLAQYHNSSIGVNDTAPPGSVQPLITDGTHIRSLHMDLFYIEEPTIGFLNMNLGMQSFTYGEYLSLALARVWAKKAYLPNSSELWRLYDERVADRGGYGRHLQFLGSARTEENVRYFVAWLNAAAVKHGGRQIDGLPKQSQDIVALWGVARFGRNILDGGRAEPRGVAASSYLPGQNDDTMFASYHDVVDEVFNDFW